MKKSKAAFSNYAALIVMNIITFTIASLFFVFILKDPSPVPVFIIFCIIQCGSMTLFALLPERFKSGPRHASKILIGMMLLIMAGILGRQNFQIEGFFYLLLAGFFGGAILHFCMKVLGTLLTGRAWCAWGCWTAAVLDLLPYKNNTSWKKGTAKHIRYLHILSSLALTLAVFFVFKHSMQSTNPDAQKNWMESAYAAYWMGLGNLFYYAAGITLAFALKDNRAFCKYLCPVAVLLKISGRVSLTRISAKSRTCSGCRTCERVCPASIAVHRYVESDGKIRSTECFMCLNCIAACPEGNLYASVGCSFAKKDHLL